MNKKTIAISHRRSNSRFSRLKGGVPRAAGGGSLTHSNAVAAQSPCGVEDPSVLRTAPLSGGAISNSRASSGASDALPLFALSAIGQPTAPAFDALQNPDAARPYAPGWKRTVDDAETVFLRTGPDADAQGTIYGDGLNLLPTDLFNGLDNPRWIISGGGTDNYNNTGKTKNQTVEENVVTALKNIFKMVRSGTGPGSRYDGTNGYVHLTLTDVTEVANGVFQYGTQLLSLSLPKAESIGNSTFSNCYALTTLSLPAVQSIEAKAFDGCPVLTHLDISGVTDESQVHRLAFSGIGNDQAAQGGTDRTNQCTLILNPALRSACTDADGGKTGPLVQFHGERWKEIQFLE